ncbi:MAG: hypothetical protein IKN74_07475 [Clostridia bacterium]|nr:hypothetical protein [Clostridia bacterium]
MHLGVEQRDAYSEVLEVLRHMQKKYVDKIPRKVIMFFYDNCNLDSEFRLTKPLFEEELSPKAVELIVMLNLNYWESVKNRDELIMKYAAIDPDSEAEKRLNAQLEKENKFTRIETEEEKEKREKAENKELTISNNKIIMKIKEIFTKIKIFLFGK